VILGLTFLTETKAISLDMTQIHLYLSSKVTTGGRV
jgi:hypothetical protein